ncbi:MAG: long-chain-acyl-CoA synthetase [Candidatus Helarchaeota archaeon]|nr:long-chain-acyl-CoA synthetase [Candidatus Helarchaeota archaeon]
MKDIAELNKNPNRSIGICIEQLASKSPERIGLHFQDTSWTWQAFNEESNRIANYFLKFGLNPGETIALMASNSPEYLFLVCGINKIQGISGLINFNQKRQALIHSFNMVNPKLIIVDGESLPSFLEIVESLPHKNDQIFVVNNINDIPHDFMDLPIELKSASSTNPGTTFNSNLQQTAFYIFTSGTTGLPKAIIMKHQKMFTQALFVGKTIAQLTPNDVIYIVTPLYHTLAGAQTWIASILSGVKTVLKKRFSASKFWKDIQKYKVTFTNYVGVIPGYLLNQPPSEYEKNSTLKYMVGMGLKKEIWEQFKSRFKVEHIIEYYGLSEGHRGFINVDEVPGMIGRNISPGVILAKIDPETSEFYKNEKGFHVKCKPGDVGMVLIRVSEGGLFSGYRDGKKTKKKLMQDVFKPNDVYFNSGDTVQLHEDSWLSFYDRTGDTFRWKGENVSTLEVESILNSHPPIVMSCVYGVAIPNMSGKAGMAAIKLDPTIKFEMDRFSRFIDESLPRYSIPIFIRICDELELTGSLKIKKFNIKKEGYNIEILQEPLFFWDSSVKKYIPFNNSIYQEILDGKLKM